MCGRGAGRKAAGTRDSSWLVELKKKLDPCVREDDFSGEGRFFAVASADNGTMSIV